MTPHDKIYLSRASLALALAGALACGGGDQQMQPQTPSGSTTTTGATPAPLTEPTSTPEVAPTSPNTPPPAANPMDTSASTPPTGGTPGGTVTTTGTGMTGSAAQTPMAMLTDGQIAAVVEAANGGEIAQAREALRKAKSDRVKRFAQHMLTDHNSAEASVRSVESKASISPQDNTTSADLKSSGAEILSTLKSSSGADFDQSYIAAQVNEHSQLLNLLDTTLIPSAQNSDLRSTLQSIRTSVASHLNMAKDIQSALSK
jgi:putative membrane protein